MVMTSTTHSECDVQLLKPVAAALARFPNAVSVSDETGFRVPTYLAPSKIPGAGVARYTKVALKKGEIIRLQSVEDGSLIAFKDLQSIQKFIAKEGIDFVANFSHAGPQDEVDTKGLVLINNPPYYINHGSKDEKNAEALWQGRVKISRTSKDVEAGEEILEDYREFGEIKWFEEFLMQEGRLPVRRFGELLG